MSQPARKSSAKPSKTKARKPQTRPDVSAKAGDGKAKAKVAAKPKGLTDQQKRFVSEYIKDRNATAAYKRAGYRGTGNVAEVNAARMLRNAQVRAAVNFELEKVISKAEESTGITLERVVKEIGKLAFFDPRAMFNEDGSPKSITELGDNEAAALAGFEMLEQFEGSGADRVFVGHLKKFKLSERKAGLDMLMKHLGGYAKDNEQKSQPIVEALASFTASLHERRAGRIKFAQKDGKK